MSRAKRIELLLHLAEERGQDATRTLAHRRQLLDETGSRLGELLDYREQCAWGGAAQGVRLAACLQDHWRFLSRLHGAIEEQRERLDQQRLAVEQSLERWQEAQRQVAILEKVRDRIRAADLRAWERREQRAADDRRSRLRGALAAEEA